MREIYTAPTVEAAEARFAEFAGEWEDDLSCDDPGMAVSLGRVRPVPRVPARARKIVYTTNAIESLNARFRRAVRHRGHFPTEQAALKVLYLVATQNGRTGRHDRQDQRLEDHPQHANRPLRRPDRRERHQLKSMTATTAYTKNLTLPWSEFGVADGGQYIYTYRSGDARYWYDSRLPVDVGEEATVRVRHCAGAGNLGVCTDVLWGTPDQFWLNVVLGNSDRLRCWNANQSGNCRGTAWVYAAWGDSTPPDLGGPLDVRNIRVRVDLHNWDLLSAANYGTGETTNDNGYCAHIVDHSWKYWATRAASC